MIDVVRELSDYGLAVDVHDPCVSAAEAHREHGLELLDVVPATGSYEAVVVAVAHRVFRELGAASIRACVRPGGVVFDVKGILPRDSVDGRL